MNAHDLTSFIKAVELAKEGHKEKAYHQLKALLKTNNNHRDPNVLLWFAYTSPRLEESETALATSAQLDPNNPALPAAQQWLAQEKLKRQEEEAPVAKVEELVPLMLKPPRPRFRTLAIACGVLAFLLLAALMLHKFAGTNVGATAYVSYLTDNVVTYLGG